MLKSIIETHQKKKPYRHKASIYDGLYASLFLSIGIVFAGIGVLALYSHGYVGLTAYLMAVLGGALIIASGFFISYQRRKIRHYDQRYRNLQKKRRLLQISLDERGEENDALKKVEQKNSDIIHSIKDVIFELDEEGFLIFLNKSWQDMTGFEIEQSVGQSIFNVIHQSDADVFKGEFEKLVQGKSEHFSAFTQVRKFDGTFRAVEIDLSIIAKDQKDGRVHVAGTITDIEERRRAERALGEAEKKYRSIVQHAAGGIYQLTPEGLYLSANPALARILGFDKPEKILREIKNANESVYVDENERFRFIQKLQDQQDTLHHETQVKRRDGAVIWVNESARLVRDENGQVLFIEGSMEDITERKESEMTIQEAKQQSDLANRAKSEFLSNMSHELRTPLNSIIGFSEMIKNEVFGPVGQEVYGEYANNVHESGQQLLKVINEILDISKIEAGERQLNEHEVSVVEIVRNCFGLLEHKIENNELTTTVFLDDAPNLFVEELSLKQILMNLLSNAVKFTPQGGRITVTGQTDEEGRYHLSVSDTGIGLDESGIQKALSPFGQLDTELSRSGSGTGLGLTLVDSLIKLHGGEFDLFSQKGIGTTATVIFPAERVRAKEQQAEAASPEDQTSSFETS